MTVPEDKALLAVQLLVEGNSLRSTEGNASAPTIAFLTEPMSMPCSAARSSRIFKKDGVPT